jgi:hypothetical protein
MWTCCARPGYASTCVIPSQYTTLAVTTKTINLRKMGVRLSSRLRQASHSAVSALDLCKSLIPHKCLASARPQSSVVFQRTLAHSGCTGASWHKGPLGVYCRNQWLYLLGRMKNRRPQVCDLLLNPPVRGLRTFVKALQLDNL